MCPRETSFLLVGLFSMWQLQSWTFTLNYTNTVCVFNPHGRPTLTTRLYKNDSSSRLSKRYHRSTGTTGISLIAVLSRVAVMGCRGGCRRFMRKSCSVSGHDKDRDCSVFRIILFLRPSYNKANLHRSLRGYLFSLSASTHPRTFSCGFSKESLRVPSGFTSCHGGRILVRQH